MKTMRAKLRLSEVKQHPQPSGEVHEDLKFFAVSSRPYDKEGNNEDNTFARWTPSAELKMSITNPALVGTMNSGDEFYVDFVRLGQLVQEVEPAQPEDASGLVDIESFAGELYEDYCAAVGGVAFNGDPLPKWEEFRTDLNKTKQSEAWVKVAQAAFLKLG